MPVCPARWCVGAPVCRRPGASVPWRRRRLCPPARTAGAPGGEEIKSLHDCDKPNGCARIAMIGGITQKLRRNYADYAEITHAEIMLLSRRNNACYAEITQKLRRNYAEITPKSRKKNCAKITRHQQSADCVMEELICVMAAITLPRRSA